MGVLGGIGKESGADAAKELHGAADDLAGAAQNVSHDLSVELADGVSITADAINRLNQTIAEESAAWRGEVSKLTAQVSRFNDFLDRIQIAGPK